jgi:SAM-dependent methyltransferase
LSVPVDKPYHRDIDRIRALYRIPPAPRPGARTLDLFTGDAGSLDPAAPACVPCRIDADAGGPLPFDAASFDYAVLHGTLDALSASDGQAAAARRDALLTDVFRVLAPGGVVAGTAANESLVRRLLPAARRGARGAGLSLRTAERALRSLGLVEVRVFTLVPNAQSPLRLVEVHDEVARAFFAAEVRRQRTSLPWWGFLVRDLLVRTGLYADLQPSLFFWGRRP